MPLHFERLDGMTQVADTFASFFANLPFSFWLDRENHPTERFSIIGTGVQADSKDLGQISDLSKLLNKSSFEAELPFSFRPGIVGVLNYEHGKFGEPLGDFLMVDRAIVFDHENRKMYFLGEFATREEFDFWYHAALLRLALIGGDAKNYQNEFPAATSALLKAEQNTVAYLENIKTAQRQIANGEVYQLCLTNRLRGEYTGDPLAYFLRLRRSHSAPYAAFIKTSRNSYVSLSPERLLSVSNGVAVSTPIKGTRPRSKDRGEDEALRNELQLDPKERAENLMIVDLIRNDLAMVCDPESVQVEKLLEVVSYSTVHQLVSEISGKLLPGKTAVDALEALFPGGSMTGAPKSRAIELIEELESSRREGYSGAIGYLGSDGSCDLGMVIRTAIFSGNQVTIGIGGGITIDSEPEKEHAEIQLKANALTSALSAQVDW
jgi:para-aminobenzoate synthetase